MMIRNCECLSLCYLFLIQVKAHAQAREEQHGACIKAKGKSLFVSMGDYRKYLYLFHGRLLGFPKGRGGSRL